MAAKLASDKAKKKALQKVTHCPNVKCGKVMKPVMFAGWGKKGMYWVCDDCGHQERTGN